MAVFSRLCDEESDEPYACAGDLEMPRLLGRFCAANALEAEIAEMRIRRYDLGSASTDGVALGALHTSLSRHANSAGSNAMDQMLDELFSTVAPALEGSV